MVATQVFVGENTALTAEMPGSRPRCGTSINKGDYMADIKNITKLTSVDDIDICIGEGIFPENGSERFISIEQPANDLATPDIVVIRPSRLRVFIRSLTACADYLGIQEEKIEDPNQGKLLDLDTLELNPELI